MPTEQPPATMRPTVRYGGKGAAAGKAFPLFQNSQCSVESVSISLPSLTVWQLFLLFYGSTSSHSYYPLILPIAALSFFQHKLHSQV